ncbi:MAG: 50S ribosomal protein L24 [Candidatus Omnitrophica bacterium]|nr:50S ribosomal protein L24 [Candidatus Omnitrophota bacterium]
MSLACIRKGDTVMVMKGRDKGKTGRVLQIFTRESMALIQGCNFVKRHLKPRSAEQPGGIVQKEEPVHFANLKVFCGKCSKPTRVKVNVSGDGRKNRLCRLCNDAVQEAK